jgi:hypothetical protein
MYVAPGAMRLGVNREKEKLEERLVGFNVCRFRR